MPDPEGAYAPTIKQLNLRDANVWTIIWATGFTGDFRWIHLPVFNPDGSPIHRRGISPRPGLYFIGFPWLSKRKSGIIIGIEEDARYIAGVLAEQI